MELELKEIKSKETWENFFLEQKEKTFLNSWNWGDFNKIMRNKIWRIGIYDHQDLVAVCLAILIQAKRGRFLLVQHGPVIKNQESEFKNKDCKFEIFKAFLLKLKEIAKKEKAVFLRIAPLLERNEENIKLFKSLGFRESPMHASAYEATWKVDLWPSENELLMKMRKTTRYLIRQVMKNQNIIIEKSDKLKDINLYQKLNEKVSKRQNFVPFSFDFTKNEFEVFLKDNQALLFFGKYKNDLACGALIIFWQGIGFYHQAASDAKYGKFSIPYLLLWEAIKEAKKRNCYLFDFWGFVDPEKHPKHPWAGPTLFKMGFGGYKREYLKTQDFPFSKKYWLIFILEKLRKIKRHL